MKKLLGILLLTGIVWSCTNNETKAPPGDKKTTAADPSQHPDYKKGFDLVAASDCYTCHNVGEKVVGPAYVDVAKKYAGQDGAVDTLAHSIIKGSVGKWGQVMMTPHANLSEEDAKAMAKYILTLNQ